MVRKRTDDDSVTYWFPWKHPMARRRGLEFGVFDQTPPKTGSALRSSFLHKTTTTIRALPFAFFAAFARKHNSNVVSALRASPLERRKCTRRQFFALSMSASRSRTCFAQLRPRWVCEHCIYVSLINMFRVLLVTYQCLFHALETTAFRTVINTSTLAVSAPRAIRWTGVGANLTLELLCIVGLLRTWTGADVLCRTKILELHGRPILLDRTSADTRITMLTVWKVCCLARY